MGCKSDVVWQLENCGDAAAEAAEALLPELLTVIEFLGPEQLQVILGAGVTVVFVDAPEDQGTINLSLQVNDALGDPVEEAYSFYAWLSDDAGGVVTSTAPDTVAIGTDGLIIEEHTAGASFELITDATGALDLDISEATATGWYLNVRLPDGTVVSSDLIAFAGP